MEKKKHKTSLNIDAELFKLLKVKAALEEIEITQAFEEAIRQYVSDVQVSTSKTPKRKP